jgi:hypothetical protein
LSCFADVLPEFGGGTTLTLALTLCSCRGSLVVFGILFGLGDSQLTMRIVFGKEFVYEEISSRRQELLVRVEVVDAPGMWSMHRETSTSFSNFTKQTRVNLPGIGN